MYVYNILYHLDLHSRAIEDHLQVSIYVMIISVHYDSAVLIE